MSAPERHQVEPDGYCPSCGTVGCRQPRQQPARTGGLAAEVRALREDLAAIAAHLGIAAVRCPACGATHRAAACPSCGHRADVAAPPPADDQAAEVTGG